MSRHYGIFDAALYGEQGGYPLAPPPPPAPQRSYAAGVIVGIQITLVAIIVLTIFWVRSPGAVAKLDMRVLPHNTCQEDEPCWDCSTMGNRVCGTCSDQVIDLRPLRTSATSCNANRP